MNTHTLKIGARTVAYALTHSARKSVEITIRPDSTVHVRAPHGIAPDALNSILQRRSAWITRHLDKMAARPRRAPISTRRVDNAYHFLGARLPVEIVPANSRARETVTLCNGTIRVCIKNAQDEQRIDQLIDQWSRAEAMQIFAQRLVALFEQFNGQIHTQPELRLRRMRARWGSCSNTGKITLNTKLIHLDLALIDYVIMHELCHLIEHNHSKRFYALLARMMPDWKARRARLHAQGMPE